MVTLKKEDGFYKHSVNEMAHLGNTKKEHIEVWVFSGEGPIPHLHFILRHDAGNRNAKEFKGCLCLKEAAYFTHGEYQAKLNHDQLKDLIAFLKSPRISHGFNPGWSNYTECCNEWNNNNSQYAMDNQEMPDYSTINN